MYSLKLYTYSFQLYSLPHQYFFEQNKFQESVRFSEMGARQLLQGKK